jgi:beta-carotene hydroxylase
MLAALSAGGWTIAWVGYLSGHVPGWVAVVLNFMSTYIGLTVFHESAHGTGFRSERSNRIFAVVPALMLTMTPTGFGICHLKHHAHINDPDLDPDHWVARRPAALRLFWLVTTAVNYRYRWYRNGWGTPWQRRRQMVFDVVLLSSPFVAASYGHLAAALVLYWIPTPLAGIFLFYTFDFLPHYPFSSSERFKDTRVQLGRVRHAILLGQSYHLVHHLWMNVPWFHYRAVFEALEPELRERGIRVD